VLVTVMGLAAKIGKTAVVAGVCDGFIGNRMIEQYARRPVSCSMRVHCRSRWIAPLKRSDSPWAHSA